MTFNSEAIRKAAVLIASVDCRTADALLDQMPDEQAARVRQAVMDLTSSDLADCDFVIAEFLRNGDAAIDDLPQQNCLAGDDPVIPANPESTEYASLHERQANERRTSPLDLVPVPILARRLASERPQLMTVVVAHMSATRAAELLHHLPIAVQTDILRCVAEHDTTDTTLLREIEQQILTEWQAGELDMRETSRGMSTAQAILNSLNPSQRDQVLGRLAKVDCPLASRLESCGPSTLPREDAVVTSIPASSDIATARGTAQIPHPNVEFDDLNQLDDRSLARVFREADWPTLILALTGASPQLVDRLARQLPPRAARMLRQRVENPGHFRLRDIELAQQEIAFLIADLASRALIRVPRRRSFTIAA